MGDATRIKR